VGAAMPWSEVQAEAPKEEEEKVRAISLVYDDMKGMGGICGCD